MKLTWHGHSCFMLETEQGSVVFDPYGPEYVPGLKLPKLTSDMVVCSHGHGDHNYSAGVKLTGEAPKFSVWQIPCFHDEVNGAKRGENLITVIETENQRAVHLGDLGHMLSEEQFAKIGKADVLMVPVGGFYTIDAEAALKVVKRIDPRVTVPMHYRGEGFGYDVTSTVDEFIRGAENVKFIHGYSIEIQPDTEKMTALLSCPLS